MNIWNDDWESLGQEPWTGGAKSRRLPRGKTLGASLYELAPGTSGGLYHFHHGAEELLVVLKGEPMLRSPDGEQQLKEGDVVHFCLGPDGAHQLINRSQGVVRYLMASTLVSPEAVEYPDERKISVMARTQSQTGEPLWDIRSLPEAE
jgi:uncharacterized cupin superfamily protein